MCNIKQDETRWASIATWALDFIRALMERPIWARVLIRPVMGKLAYREFIGLINELDNNGFLTHVGYNLEDMNYHADKVPRYWWKENEC